MNFTFYSSLGGLYHFDFGFLSETHCSALARVNLTHQQTLGGQGPRCWNWQKQNCVANISGLVKMILMLKDGDDDHRKDVFVAYMSDGLSRN